MIDKYFGHPEFNRSLGLENSARRYLVTSKTSPMMDFFSAYQNAVQRGGTPTTAEVETALYALKPESDIQGDLEGISMFATNNKKKTATQERINKFKKKVAKKWERFWGPNMAGLEATLSAFVRGLEGVSSRDYMGVHDPSGLIWTRSPMIYHPDGVLGVSQDADANKEFYAKLIPVFEKQSQSEQQWSIPLNDGLAKMIMDAVDRNKGFTPIPEQSFYILNTTVETPGYIRAFDDPVFSRMRGIHAKGFCEVLERYNEAYRQANSLMHWRDWFETRSPHVTLMTGDELAKAPKDSIVVAPISLTRTSVDADGRQWRGSRVRAMTYG